MARSWSWARGISRGLGWTIPRFARKAVVEAAMDSLWLGLERAWAGERYAVPA